MESMLLRLAAISLMVFCGAARAVPPKQVAAFGIELGASPQWVASSLADRFRPCSVVRSIYHESTGQAAQHIAGLDINPGLTFNDIGAPDVCSYSLAGEGITDSIETRFAHPDIDRNQALYSIQAQRVYPDVVYSPTPRLRNSFDELRAELFRTYGRPIDERRERVASSAANLAASLGIGQNVKREDYLVRYLWATKGRLPDVENEDSTCDCGGRYVKAVIEISRSPSTIPRNRFYVLSVALFVEDSELRARQDAWNAQWARPKQ
jgi:hypothetical protein